LLTDLVWEEQALNRQRLAQRLTLPSAGEGVLSFEDTGCEKKGRHAGGVARQETGTGGKSTTCQGTVTCHSAERTRAGPGAPRLSLPEGWAAAARRQRAPVPKAIAVQTKAALALARLDEAHTCGVRQQGVTGDAEYGDNPNFLQG
jgi:SRSO17 transposase